MSAIFIDTSQLTKGAERFKNMSKQLADGVDHVLNTNALEMEEKAKQNISSQALSYKGRLLQSVSADTSKQLQKKITVGTFYAAYVEFGTGAYAAEYVSSLPAKWQEFASEFKGEGGKASIKGILFFLTDWFHIKGIDKQHAYFIARSIFLHGTRPHPVLYPAFVAQLPQLETDLENVLKHLAT